MTGSCAPVLEIPPMPIAFPLSHPLATALNTANALAPAAHAQQVVADGDLQQPPAGEYRTTEPVLPGDPAGYVFYALNGGRIEMRQTL